MAQNHVCFVWGPPLSGQRRWIARALEETEAGIQAHVYFFEEFLNEGELIRAFERLSRELDRLGSEAGTVHHLYCQLPWSITEYGLELEEWLSQHAHFGAWKGRPEEAPWGLSFAGICPFEAGALPRAWREALEEFSRSSRSDIVVTTPEENLDPAWLGTERLDFGNYVEVFEEKIWDDPIALVPVSPDFEDVAKLETCLYSLHLEEPTFVPLLRECLEGDFGEIWNAEIVWRGHDGQVHLLSTQNGQIHAWRARHPGFRQLVPENCALLEICGVGLQKEALKKLQDPKSFN